MCAQHSVFFPRYERGQMTNHPELTVKEELDRLTAEFFRAVSFESGETPPYENIQALFIETGLLIKNSATTPEISTVRQFVAPRQAMVASQTPSKEPWPVAAWPDLPTRFLRPDAG
jgi:hypothetical protein